MNETLVEEDGIVYRWGVVQEIGRDCYNVYCRKYIHHIEGFNQRVECFNLTSEGRWEQYEENEIIEPALRIPGFLIHIMNLPTSKAEDIETAIFQKFVGWINLFSQAQGRGVQL